MILCFGTFAKVLSLYKNIRVTNKEIVYKMTQIVEQNNSYHKATESTISRLLSCEYQLSNDHFGKVVSAARDAKIEDVVERFESDVIGVLRIDKKKHIMLALLDIIDRDVTLDNEQEEIFKKYFGTTKKDLLLKNEQGKYKYEFVFSNFLACAFLYTAAEVDNRNGKGCVKTITKDSLDNLFEKKNDTITLWTTDAEKLVRSNKDKTPSEKMFEIFKSATYDFGIKERLEDDDSERIVDVEGFIEIIKNKIGSVKDFKNEIIYYQIMDFTQLLMDNIKFSKKREQISDINDELASYLKKIINAETNNIYWQIKDLYDKICGREIYSDIFQDESSYESEEALEIFTQAVSKFDIENFIKINPIDISLNPDWERKVGDFTKIINCKIPNKSVNMANFICKLDEYKEYICDNMYFDDDNSHGLKGEMEEIIINIIPEISHYGRQLRSLYREICGVDISFED